MIPYKLARLVIFESLKWRYSFVTNSTLFMKLGSLLYVRCRHRSVKTVRALLSKNNIVHRTHSTKFRTQITSNSLERLAAASGCMSSYSKRKSINYRI